MLAYHVTAKRNLRSIRRQGLTPRVPEDYGENGDTLGVYCFPDIVSAEYALSNWLGDRIEELEDESGKAYDEQVLELDITGLKTKQDAGVEWEIVVEEPVTPDRILRVFTL